MKSSSVLSTLCTLLAMMLVLAVSFFGITEAAYAARTKPPIAIPTVPAPGGVQILSVSAREVTVTEIPSSGYALAVRYVSGPVPPFDLIFPIGATSGQTVRITGLVPASNYVFEMRRFSLNGQLVNSGFTRFSFRTSSLAQSAPSAPVIRVGTITPDYIDIVWNTPADDNTAVTQFRYTYSVVGNAQITDRPTCYQYCFGTTVLRLPRSASGQRIFVSAYDKDNLVSLPSNQLVVP